MKTNEVRKKFLKFFESKEHTIVMSDSLVPKDDPTLLFTSAGMNQFKNQFMGRNVTYRRATTSQKCLRTGDLDRVGKTAYHHTFFEMLGNFSFGDYFKEDAISWAWEFMTKVLKIPESKIWVSVYKDDDEAYDIWKEDIEIPEKRIVRFGDNDNFWPSNAKKDGPNGPCGPCSEIFYDWGANVGCKKPTCDPSCSCGRFVEVWNLVFTQFNRVGVDKLEPLASKNIDTGMGLERLASVMQGVSINFETDLFAPIIKSIKELVKQYDQGPDIEIITPIYAIADHIRAISFAILDGVMPSNEGRGYVIRKLIRTAFLHGRTLGLKEPFLYKLTFSVAKSMEEPYPELMRRHADIASVIKSEEEFFVTNLDMDRAAALYDEHFKEITAKFKEKIASYTASAGTVCFLNDTYGIPPEITKEVAIEKGHLSEKDKKLWDESYEKYTKELKERSRKKSGFVTDTIFAETKASKIVSSVQKTEFVGYATDKATAKVLKIFKGDEEVKIAEAKSELEIILDKTPFYAESGGQVGDSGVFKKQSAKIEVLDTKKVEGAFVHICKLVEGNIKVGDEVEAAVNSERRENIAKNHTATHLLQNALRKALGEHVHQSGSVVDENRLRFDFTHLKKLLPEELERVEDIVNGNIQNSDDVSIKNNVEVGKAMDEGAIALFGEKYGKEVRVVAVGAYSKELCGGIHVRSTSDIRLFKIISEGSVAAGLRRIEAITDNTVEKYVIEEENNIAVEIKSALSQLDEKKLDEQSSQVFLKAKEVRPGIKTPLTYAAYIKWDRHQRLELVELMESLKKIRSKMEKDTFSSKLKEAKTLASEAINNAVKIKDTLIIVKKIEGINEKILKSLADEIKSKVSSAVIVLAAVAGDKISFVCAITADLVKKGLHAGKIAKSVSAITSGSGGGRGDFALAGGKDPSKLKEALNYVYAICKEELEK